MLELTSWRGADVVVDAVGHESALAACFPLVRMGGTISLAGMYTEVEGTMPIGDMWLKNITIMAGAANIQGHMDEVIELVRDGQLDPKVIISHRMPLSQAAEGYELFENKEALKVVLDPTDKESERRRREAHDFRWRRSRLDIGGEMLEGLMQNDYQLTLKHVLDRMRGPCADGEVVDPDATAASTRASYGEVAERVDRLCKALEQLGVKQGDRVATFMWNSQEHLELYMTPCMGIVLHMLNIRLFPEQLTYIANHAKDKVIFVDDSLVPLLEKVAPTFETVEHYVIVGDGDAGSLPNALRYEDLIAEQEPGLRLPRARRAHGGGPLLHERHDRQPEGRAVLAPLERPALPRVGPRRHDRASRRPTACCRSCRCSTSTRGGSRTRARWWAPTS